jgi:O-antigen ligase
MESQNTTTLEREKKTSPAWIFRHIPGLFLLCVVFAPPLRFLPSVLSAVKAEDFLLAPMALILLFGKRPRTRSKPLRDSIPALLIYLGLCGMIGWYIGAVYYELPFAIRDIILIPQIAKYVLVYIVMKRLLASPEISDTTKWYVLISALLAALVAFAQFWNIMDFNRWFTPLYVDDKVFLSVILTNTAWKWRVQGTAINANIYGVILAWHLIFLVVHFTHTPIRKTTLVWFPVIIALLIAIALTQSRSTYLLVVMAWFLNLFAGSKFDVEKSRRPLRTLTLIIVPVIAVIGLLQSIDTSEGGFGSRLSLDSNSMQTSTGARIRDLVQPTWQRLQEPIALPFGTGPSKAALRTDSHDGYSWILLRFGLAGLFLYLALELTILRKSSRAARAGEYRGDSAVALFVFIWTCGWIFVEFTNANFKLPSLMGLNMFTAAWLSAKVSSRVHVQSPTRPLPLSRRAIA